VVPTILTPDNIEGLCNRAQCVFSSVRVEIYTSLGRTWSVSGRLVRVVHGAQFQKARQRREPLHAWQVSGRRRGVKGRTDEGPPHSSV
jgi:hypothetical protein